MPVYLSKYRKNRRNMIKRKKFAVVTCCLDDWGGSEELWARSIPLLMAENIKDITVYKHQINTDHPEFANLKAQKVKLKPLVPQVNLPKKIILKLTDFGYRVGNKLGISTYKWNKPVDTLYRYLKRDRPDLVLISQGINFDGLAFAYQCLLLKIPYIIVCHKAVNFFWPQNSDRKYMRETLMMAKKCFFVSEHNRQLTEEQFGIRLTNGSIVVNPVKLSVKPLPYPNELNGLRLACVGRLFVIDKGQDILIRVLAQQKWKERNIHVSFIGKGPDLEALVEMASLLEVKNVSFTGYNSDLNAIWTNHHALILPSRSEGLPLTITEAMMLGRMAIVTNAGGNAEIVQNQTTGFIGEANESGLDEALEMAWNERARWDQMGLLAAASIKDTLPEYPEKIFTKILCDAIENV